MSREQRHVVVIGAGPGGLAAALLLAGSGVRVTVVERRSQVGGRTSALQQDGFRFDTGPTFFLYPRILREVFSAVGRDLDVEVPMTRLDPQYRLIFGGGGEISATSNAEKMQQAIAAISPGDAANFTRFLEVNREKLRRFTPVLESPFESWRDLLKPEILGLLGLLAPWRSLDADLRRFFKDERIRLGFSFQSKYLGMSPFRCPSLFSILSFLEYEHGVYHPTGGCSAVTEAMARVAREMGVSILLDESVREIKFEGRRATGITTRSGTLDCDSVVVNADFAQAMRAMVPDKLRSKWTDRKIEKKRFSCSTFMMYLGIDGRYDDVAHHTIFLSRDYRQNLRDIEEEHQIGVDPSFYLQNACITDPSLAPRDMSTLYVLVPVTHEHANVNWAEHEQRLRTVTLRQLEKIGISDVERRIRFERRMTPVDWNREFLLHRGATFSMAHNLGQMLHRRPHNRFEDLDGVYLVGGGTHPGSGLPVIFESARITSKLLLQDLAITPHWDAQRTLAQPALEVFS